MWIFYTPLGDDEIWFTSSDDPLDDQSWTTPTVFDSPFGLEDPNATVSHQISGGVFDGRASLAFFSASTSRGPLHVSFEHSSGGAMTSISRIVSQNTDSVGATLNNSAIGPVLQYEDFQIALFVPSTPNTLHPVLWKQRYGY